MIIEAAHPFRPTETLRFDTDQPDHAYRVELGQESLLGLAFWLEAYHSLGRLAPWELMADPDLTLDGGL